jgi:hypothetical protein
MNLHPNLDRASPGALRRLNYPVSKDYTPQSLSQSLTPRVAVVLKGGRGGEGVVLFRNVLSCFEACRSAALISSAAPPSPRATLN